MRHNTLVCSYIIRGATLSRFALTLQAEFERYVCFSLLALCVLDAAARDRSGS